MSYVECTRCGRPVMTFARWWTVDSCPHCDALISKRSSNTAAAPKHQAIVSTTQGSSEHEATEGKSRQAA
jgi:hypothetical protein